MFFRDPYKDQLIKRIESLIAAGSFEKANDLCSEVLEKEPEDADMQRLVNLIEEKVQEANEKRIDEVLENLASLWKEEKYLEIIQKLNDVKKYSKSYPPLLDALSKAESAYRKRLEKGQSEELKKVRQKFADLLKEKKLDEIVEKCLDIDNSPIKNPALIALAAEMKVEVVDAQLTEKKDFLKSDKYDEILGFLQNLTNITPKYQKLLNLIEEIKLRKINNISAEREETSYQAVDKVKDLLRLGNYEAAYAAAQELKIFNPGSRIAEQLFQEAEAKFNNILRDETAEQIKKAKPAIKEDYLKNKDQYRKI